MEELIDKVSEMCFDLSDELRNETESGKRRELLLSHLDNVSKLSEKGARIPDFKPGLEWLNVSEPLSLRRQLRGKLVLLDFFTYCCVNCMHVLPDLKLLEREFSVEDGLVVVGVHSAKFTNERVTRNIEAAVRRYGIAHPVVNDVLEGMWKNLGVCCWPTLYMLGPDSEPLLVLQGEGHYRTLRTFIGGAISYYTEKGTLNRNEIAEVSGYRGATSSSLLLYPGKVSVDGKGERLAVSDTAHHRVLVLSVDGRVLEEVGGCDSGFEDGNFTTAKFFSPQGTVFDNNNNDLLYVADTENHAIRVIDISRKEVKTLVGNGKEGGDYAGGKEAISSPWDVDLVGDALYIAMAGTHQIWAYFFRDTTLWNKSHKGGSCGAVVGSGREECRNNRYPLCSGLAQPSGLSHDSLCLYLADSESSTVRAVSLDTGAVSLLAGGSPDPTNLFAFGDKDGAGSEAKLQHPLGVAWSPHDDLLYVADSYNHKIKRIEKGTKRCTTVQLPELNEPGGLCAFGEKLFIADTNRHRVMVLNLESSALEKLEIHYRTDTSTCSAASEKTVITVNSGGGEVNASVEIVLPDGVTLTEDAPSKWSIHLPGGKVLTYDEGFTLRSSLRFPVVKEDFKEEKELRIKCTMYLCTPGKCTLKELLFPVVVNFDKDARSEVDCSISHVVPLDLPSE